MYVINRSTLILFHKLPLIEWQNKIFPDDQMEYEPNFFQNDMAHVYLTPEFESDEEFENWMKENFVEIFIDVLADWCVDEKLWPKDLTYKLFKEWFHINYQSMVIDTLDEPIEVDDFED